MGGRWGKSTESALELLTAQLHALWDQGRDKVSTLLSMDVAGAFDTVSNRRLIHSSRKRKITNELSNGSEVFLVIGGPRWPST